MTEEELGFIKEGWTINNGWWYAPMKLQVFKGMRIRIIRGDMKWMNKPPTSDNLENVVQALAGNVPVGRIGTVYEREANRWPHLAVHWDGFERDAPRGLYHALGVQDGGFIDSTKYEIVKETEGGTEPSGSSST